MNPRCTLCYSQEIDLFYQKKDKNYGIRTYWKCNRCALVFLSPSEYITRAEERRVYEQHQNTPSNEGYVRFLQQLTVPIASKLEPRSEGLDFGCGPGPTTSVLLSSQGFKVENYDPLFFPNASLLGRKYDFITCSEVVEHMHRPIESFLLLKSLLKSQTGILGIMTQTIEDERRFPNWWYHRDPTHVSFYREETFQWLAQKMGWTVEKPKKNIFIFRSGLKVSKTDREPMLSNQRELSPGPLLAH